MDRITLTLSDPVQAHNLQSFGGHMKTKETITGQTFGRLTAIRFDRYEKERTFWIFRCVCGTEKSQGVSQVRRGITTSCGCLRVERVKEATTKHGMSKAIGGKKTRVYQAYSNMIQRCENTKTKHFHRYGGRGIKVCARWRESFKAFLEDMGEPPEGLSLDRIDNDGDYEPSNCRWVNQKTQNANRSVCIFVEIDGKAVMLMSHCEAIGVSYNMVRKRLKRGWSLDFALKVRPKK